MQSPSEPPASSALSSEPPASSSESYTFAVPPGDPVNVAVVVEEVVPGIVAGAIQGLVEPQFGSAGRTGRFAGARAGVFGCREGLSSSGAAERKGEWVTVVRTFRVHVCVK